MKTRDRILHTSLLLFNEEGEPNTTTVDIANEMDISPGNLYYHFKGKDVIIAELFSQYEQGLGEILNAPLDQPLSVEDNWFYLYVVFEEMYNYRFLYRNLSDLLLRYPRNEGSFPTHAETQARRDSRNMAKTHPGSGCKRRGKRGRSTGRQHGLVAELLA